MIPKIIHYIWFGGNPLPAEMQECMDSWKQFLPEYQLMLWNEENISEFESIFIEEALSVKKYAFASDVVRLFAVYKYGGIYMDTDVMVYRPFDDLLENKAFIGRENSMHQIGHSMENYVTTCCFGAEKGNFFIKKCLDYYNGRHFITTTETDMPEQLKYDMRLNSEVFCVLAKEAGWNSSLLADEIQYCKDNILTVYPQRFFDATKSTTDLYTRHLALGTWRGKVRKQYSYSWKYKIQWRIRACVEWLLRKYDYVMIKLK